MTDPVTVPTSALQSRIQNREPITIAHRLRRAGSIVIHHAKKHTGVGVVCAVAYFDPGNWGVDLQAGSEYGYWLLFVVLLAGLFAVFLQVLATRLGCVTGIDLGSHTRLLLYNRPKHTLLYRWLGLYPLYVLAEVAIIATDLAELLGSAIALCMLFPSLELWHGVLITAFDVLLVFAMGDPLRGKPVKMFELLIAALVLAVLVCMIVIITKVGVNWAHAFEGYIPTKHIFASGGVYTSVGILGATIMPHSLFLGSTLATQDRVSFRSTGRVSSSSLTPVNSKEAEAAGLLPAKRVEEVSFIRRLYEDCKGSVLGAFRKPPGRDYTTAATRHSEHRNNPFEFVRAHIYHGTFDVVGSLLGFAVMINSLILMLAAAVFFYGNTTTNGPASLFDAYDLIRDLVGQPAATLFAIALLCAGQSSSIIATVAGQAVSEGFIRWRVSPVIRRLATRLLAIIPSMAVALVVGRQGIDKLLVTSQVVLSIVLPFITFPLLYCTSSKAIMSVRKRSPGALPMSETLTAVELPSALQNRSPDMVENADTDEVVDFSNNRLTIGVGGAIWLVIVAANFYVLVELGAGKGTA
ncbi:natural resistance-associated macrophage protein-domain-containing protein [Pholiota molesta]|nr:natural resistance-associated macrophage protein-domain-containing protein [Pholiota molesta]